MLGEARTYHREVPHHPLGCAEDIANVCALLHETKRLAPSHMTQEVPGKEGNPIGNITCLAAVRTIHEPRLELGTEVTKIFVHGLFQYKSIL